jgi:ABC-type Fe3+ transport system permease subunit
MVERPRPKILPVRDRAWRHTVAIRLGVPLLAVVLALTVAWLLSRL